MINLWVSSCRLRGRSATAGWAFVAEQSGNIVHKAKGAGHASTPHRMEVVGTVEAIGWAVGRGPVTVCAQSDYVPTGLEAWRKRRREDGEGWAELDRLIGTRDVTFRQVEGRMGSLFREEAERLATIAAWDASGRPFNMGRHGGFSTVVGILAQESRQREAERIHPDFEDEIADRAATESESLREHHRLKVKLGESEARLRRTLGKVRKDGRPRSATIAAQVRSIKRQRAKIAELEQQQEREAAA